MRRAALEVAERIIDEVLKDDRDECPVVVAGPIVWQPGPNGRRWYFILASSDAGGFFTVQAAITDDREAVAEVREAFIAGLVERRPIIVHIADDELDMARWCEAIWPCADTRKIRSAIEAERRARKPMEDVDGR